MVGEEGSTVGWGGRERKGISRGQRSCTQLPASVLLCRWNVSNVKGVVTEEVRLERKRQIVSLNHYGFGLPQSRERAEQIQEGTVLTKVKVGCLKAERPVSQEH